MYYELCFAYSFQFLCSSIEEDNVAGDDDDDDDESFPASDAVSVFGLELSMQPNSESSPPQLKGTFFREVDEDV